MKDVSPYVFAGLNVNKENSKSIKILVCKALGVSLEEVEGGSRRSEIIIAKQMGMYFIRDKNPTMPLRVIANMFGLKNHATVLWAIKNVGNLCETDRDYRRKFESIKKQLEDTIRGSVTAVPSEKTISSLYGRHVKSSKILQ